MDRLLALQAFARVVELGGFTKAGVSATSDGAAFYERCAHILAELDEAEAALRAADELGSVEAPNDLALLLRHRATRTSDRSACERLLTEGEQAFRRADERGSRDGARNVASLLSKRAAATADEKEWERLQDETLEALRRFEARQR